MNDNQPRTVLNVLMFAAFALPLVIGAFIAVPIAYEEDFATAAVVQGIAIVCGAICAHGVKGMV